MDSVWRFFAGEGSEPEGEGRKISLIVSNKFYHNEELRVDVRRTDTIRSVKDKLQDVSGITPSSQRLVRGNHECLDDSKRISDYELADEEKLEMHVRLRGGCDCCYDCCPMSSCCQCCPCDCCEEEDTYAPTDPLSRARSA